MEKMENQGTIAAFLIVGLLVGLGVGYMLPGLMTPPPVEPTDLLETIQDRGYMVVGTSSGFYPFEMVNTTTSALYGFDIDLAEYVATELGVTVQWQDMDFGNLVGACGAGTIDMIAAATFITADRNEQLLPSVWYLRANMVIIVKNSSVLTVASYDDLDGLDVGVQTGTAEDFELLDHNDAGGTISIQEYPYLDQMFLDLNSGLLDAIYIDEPVLPQYDQIYDLKIIYTVLAPPMAFYVAYDNPDFYEAVNNAMAKAFETGFIDDLILEYFM
ncbi:MAG: Glutamine-binding periplasmic protein precursor [Candidatus Thorarchaeota archaeon AB_25]|nr:MAG: Glutamine-binding periplasmic protein precursor [Candidatus Thorarchaeota archaeon AB_25]